MQVFPNVQFTAHVQSFATAAIAFFLYLLESFVELLILASGLVALDQLLIALATRNGYLSSLSPDTTRVIHTWLVLATTWTISFSWLWLRSNSVPSNPLLRLLRLPSHLRPASTDESADDEHSAVEPPCSACKGLTDELEKEGLSLKGRRHDLEQEVIKHQRNQQEQAEETIQTKQVNKDLEQRVKNLLDTSKEAEIACDSLKQTVEVLEQDMENHKREKEASDGKVARLEEQLRLYIHRQPLLAADTSTEDAPKASTPKEDVPYQVAPKKEGCPQCRSMVEECAAERATSAALKSALTSLRLKLEQRSESDKEISRLRTELEAANSKNVQTVEASKNELAARLKTSKEEGDALRQKLEASNASHSQASCDLRVAGEKIMRLSSDMEEAAAAQARDARALSNEKEQHQNTSTTLLAQVEAATAAHAQLSTELVSMEQKLHRAMDAACNMSETRRILVACRHTKTNLPKATAQADRNEGYELDVSRDGLSRLHMGNAATTVGNSVVAVDCRLDWIFDHSTANAEVSAFTDCFARRLDSGRSAAIVLDGYSGSGKTSTGIVGNHSVALSAFRTLKRLAMTDVHVACSEFIDNQERTLDAPHSKTLEKHNIVKYDVKLKSLIMRFYVVQSESAFAAILQHVQSARASATTVNNNTSSRSHLSLEMWVESKRSGADQKQQKPDRLVIVDLAGNEQFGSAGDTSETVKINISRSEVRDYLMEVQKGEAKRSLQGVKAWLRACLPNPSPASGPPDILYLCHVNSSQSLRHVRPTLRYALQLREKRVNVALKERS